MADSAKEVSKTISIRRTHTDKTFVFYANDTWIGHTRFELQMNFARIPTFAPQAPGDPIPDHVESAAAATIIVTVDHAKAILKALATQIEKFEKRKAEAEMTGDDESL